MSFSESVETWRQVDGAFAHLYDNAEPYQRLMLRGIHPSFWRKALENAERPEPPIPYEDAATTTIAKLAMPGADERVIYRCGEARDGKRCNRRVARGFSIPDASSPTGVIVFNGTVYGKTVLCSVSMVITRPASRGRIEPHRGVPGSCRRRQQVESTGGAGDVRQARQPDRRIERPRAPVAPARTETRTGSCNSLTDAHCDGLVCGLTE